MSTEPSHAVRFWPKVNKTATCWEWIAAVGRHGYGQFMLAGQSRLAHRVAYELLRGPIPEGLTLDHLCRNKRCVNPDHLEAVSQRVNTLRGLSPAAFHALKTHCPKGHPYDEANTEIRPKGNRHCLTCRGEQNRKRRLCDNCGKTYGRAAFDRHQRSEAARAAA